MDVVLLLKRRGKVTAKNVAAWFEKPQALLSKAGVCADDDMSLNLRKIEQHMRVFARLTPVVAELLLMESIHGSKHPLISMKVLEMILGMTSVENPSTSAALIRYGVRGIIVSTLRGTLHVGASASQVKIVLHEWLFNRRIYMYLKKRVKYADAEGVEYVAGRSPTSVLERVR
jgi:hypothetical protein